MITVALLFLIGVFRWGRLAQRNPPVADSKEAGCAFG